MVGKGGTVLLTEGEHVSSPGFRSGSEPSVTPALLLLLHRCTRITWQKAARIPSMYGRPYITTMKDV